MALDHEQHLIHAEERFTASPGNSSFSEINPANPTDALYVEILTEWLTQSQTRTRQKAGLQGLLHYAKGDKTSPPNSTYTIPQEHLDRFQRVLEDTLRQHPEWTIGDSWADPEGSTISEAYEIQNADSRQTINPKIIIDNTSRGGTLIETSIHFYSVP